MMWGARFATFAGIVAIVGVGIGVKQVIAGGAAEPRRLAAALPTKADLPDGYGRLVSAPWPAPIKPPKGPCRAALSAITNHPEAAASASFLGDGVGESGGVQLATYPDNQHMEKFHQISSDLRDCEGWRGFSASDLELTDVGDASTAASWKGQVRGIPYGLHLVAARTGHTLVLVAHGTSGKGDAKATEQLVRSAVHKLDE